MKSDFLFELGTEELPPKALLSLSHAFTESILDGFIAQGLSFEGSTSYAAPRRLAIYIKGLDGSTPDSDIVSWGPPARVAFDEAGAPTKAAGPIALARAACPPDFPEDVVCLGDDIGSRLRMLCQKL